MRRRPAVVLVSLGVAAVALLAAGCGGGGNSPGVANIDGAAAGATDTTTTQSGSESAGKGSGNPGVGPSGQFQIAMNVGAKDGAKFSACMRKQGITNFPDPNGQGVIMIHSGMGIDPGSPAFGAARATCSKLLPNGGQPTPAQIAQRQQQLLALSACMRSHGIKDFPDPSNGGLKIQVHPGSDLDPGNSTFQRARQTCQKHLPFKGAGVAKVGGG